jgi:hypothetical protein
LQRFLRSSSVSSPITPCRGAPPISIFPARAIDSNCPIASVPIGMTSGRTSRSPCRFLWKPCRFGGRRPFFLCPGVVNGLHCGRVNLYCAGKYFLCRHCYRLTYTSRQERAHDRALRQVDKLRMRLGGDPGMASEFPEKPKGMHWRTYERLSNRVWEAEMLADDHFLTRVERRVKASRAR